MAKYRKRFDYTSLAEVLSQQGVADADILNAALKASAAAGIPFPEILLTQDLITDWELSRQVCKLYSLPFMPVEFYPPHPEAVKLLPKDFVRQHRLIPIGVHGDLMTVCMPGLVPAEILGQVAVMTDMHIQPMVGTVQTNGRWILENLPEDVPAALPQAGSIPDYVGLDDASGWSNLFDEGDASVLMDLGDEAAQLTAHVTHSEDLPSYADPDDLDSFDQGDQGDGGDAAARPTSAARPKGLNLPDLPPLPEIH